MLVFCIGVDYSNIYPVHSVIVAVDKCHRNTRPNPQGFTKYSCSSRLFQIFTFLMFRRYQRGNQNP